MRPAALFLLPLLLAPCAAFGMCFDEAAQLYPSVPVTWLRSIARQESGFNQSAVNKNKNGSYDVGVMQINSFWRPILGEERWRFVNEDACYNVIVGAWVLNQCVERHGLTWKAIGCYNSPTAEHQLRYSSKVVPLINALEKERWAEYRRALKLNEELRAKARAEEARSRPVPTPSPQEDSPAVEGQPAEPEGETDS
ncbi:MAG: lytic transglycosylase domain-containing protein [Deltaproteobacteria bacterium]|nr:lytic transglycosylase domain-containing protein [Deltaproteobacteria bacterium]